MNTAIIFSLGVILGAVVGITLLAIVIGGRDK